jgi:hypothetical protein
VYFAEQVQVKWKQRKINRAAKHRATLLAATKQQLEEELSSCAARGASPVFGDDAVAEQDSPQCLVHQHAPESPDIHDSPVGKKRRLVTVQHYPWKFVSPQLLDRDGQEIFYPVDDDRDRWWARKMEWAIDHHRDLAERDLDDLQAKSSDVVRKVQQKMEMEKCCFCRARNEHENNCNAYDNY